MRHAPTHPPAGPAPHSLLLPPCSDTHLWIVGLNWSVNDERKMRTSFGWETRHFGNFSDLARLAGPYGLGARPGLAALADAVLGLAVPKNKQVWAQHGMRCGACCAPRVNAPTTCKAAAAPPVLPGLVAACHAQRSCQVQQCPFRPSSGAPTSDRRPHCINFPSSCQLSARQMRHRRPPCRTGRPPPCRLTSSSMLRSMPPWCGTLLSAWAEAS